MKIKKVNSLLGSKLYEDAKIVVLEEEFDFSKFVIQDEDDPYYKMFFKPTGFWYGVGNSWTDWLVSNNLSFFKGTHVYELQLDETKILKIDTEEALINFAIQYQGPKFPIMIRWEEIKDSYDGIEISPYQNNCRFTVPFYYPWDVASGCFWNKEIIKDIKLICKY